MAEMALDQISSLPLLIATFVLVLTFLLLDWWRKNNKLPPGPWGFPILGYFPFLRVTHLDFTRLSKKYGKVLSFRTVGGSLIVVLNGHKTIKEVLVNRAEEFIGRPHANDIIWWMSDGIGIAQEEGQTWKEQRRFFLQTAKNFGFGKQDFEIHILDEIKILLQELRKFDGQPNDLRFHLAYTFGSIFSKFLFGRKFDKDASFKRNLASMRQMAEIFKGVLHMIIGFPFYIATNIIGDKRYPRGRNEARKIVDQVVDEVKQNYNPINPNSFIDFYLQQMDELKKKGKLQESSFTEQRLKAQAFNLIFGAMESTSSTVAGFLVQLSKHPNVQKNIQEELDSIVGRERLPSWTDKQILPYLDATIQELSRVAAPFLVTTMYSNFKETTIEGYRIPERSVIVSNLYSIHFDPELFPNPEKFDPGRFLDSEGKRIKVQGGPYLFGLGKRNCIAESIAQVEIFLLIGSLLQSFTIPYTKDAEGLRAIPRE